MEKFDIAVIGSGVVGSLVAREMTKYKVSVVVLEKCSDVSMGATKANSAIVHAGFDAAEGSLKAKLNVKGSEMMESLAKELNVKYKRNGAVVVAFTEEQLPTIKELYERGQKNGVRDLKILSADETKALEPNLKDNFGSLYAPTSAIICPYTLAIAAMGNAMDNGAELLLDYEVKSIVKKEDYVISDGDREISAKVVINCAGVFSDRIANMVGDDSFTITPRKGEYILCDREMGDSFNMTVFTTPTKMGKGILMSPTVDGNLILGPTAVDIDDKEDKKTTAEGLQTVLDNTAFESSVNTRGKVITSFTGIRSVGSTGDFIINMPKENFINVAGIESPGLSSSPAIAEYVAEMVGKVIKLEKNGNFNGIRRVLTDIREYTDEEKNELIKKNKAFGKIVCRCEGITEGEILEAIRANPKAATIDGIKRRTRATMGRCQGGFCTPFIADILARELGVDLTEIRKSEKGSEILMRKTK